ncbi:unnamed protein product [Linum tenue]|uniref:MADS-box domain-containing protein n=2 Tax=Linum tenue TaxID=586396 RepID=A0AAV0NDI9_9ROSI|nr:unnamed protein product [Linum tenue]
MTRKKVKLAYIANDSARKATFKKRKKGLMKKVSELSTLCDIQACAIVYSPYDSHPETWPPTAAGVHSVLSRFKKVPQMEQCKKMVDQEKFLGERIKKAAEQLRKQERENRDKEVAQAVSQCLEGKMALHSLTLTDLDVISRYIDGQLKDVDRHIADLGRGGLTGPDSSQAVGPEVVGNSGPKEEYAESIESMQRQQWFMEMMNPAPPPGPIPVTAAERQMGFVGEGLMMMAPSAAVGGGGGVHFGESSSGSGGGGNGGYNNSNGNSFWGGNPFLMD